MEIMLDDFGLACQNVASRFPLPVWFRRWITRRYDRRCAGNFPARAERRNRDEIVPINKKYNIETFLAAGAVIWRNPTPIRAESLLNT